MPIEHVSFGIVTPQVAECRDFYVRWFGLNVASDLGWYVHLRDGQGRLDLAFLLPNSPQVPAAFHGAFSSGGYLGLRVEDVEAIYRRFLAAEMTFAFELRDESWGERHFGIMDPSGLLVNVWQRMGD
jgi:catechol 2,3-dioxygenase-like lactoylglutathione lyase family enzyme